MGRRGSAQTVEIPSTITVALQNYQEAKESPAMSTPHVVVMGPPGAGKGTQSQQVATELEIKHIETGAILRANKHVETEYGTPHEYMEKGEYVPDDVVNTIVEEELTDAAAVLDGYPRTEAQVEFLDAITDLDIVLSLAVSEETLVQRSTNRRVCDQCGATYHLDFDPPEQSGICDACEGNLIQREDDTPEAIRTRVREYETKTVPLIERYRSRGLFVEIDGEQPPDDVWADIKQAIIAAV